MRVSSSEPPVPSVPKGDRYRDVDAQKHLGKAIRQLRQQAGLTQMQLGAKAGIDGHWISNIECGKVNPVWGNLRRIASGLGVTLEHLTSLTRTYELNQAIGLAVSSIRAEQGLGRRKVATRAGLTTRELEVIENGRGPLVSQQLEGRLRRGLRVQKERWFKALEAAKLQLGVS